MKKYLIAGVVALLGSTVIAQAAPKLGVSIYKFDDVWTTVMRNDIG